MDKSLGLQEAGRAAPLLAGTATEILLLAYTTAVLEQTGTDLNLVEAGAPFQLVARLLFVTAISIVLNRKINKKIITLTSIRISESSVPDPSSGALTSF